MNQSKYIRFLLKENGLHIKDLAKEMGLSTNGLSLKIAGKLRFSRSDIDFLLRKLNMQYEDVFISEDVEILQIGSTKYVVPLTNTNEIIKIVEDVKKWAKAV